MLRAGSGNAKNGTKGPTWTKDEIARLVKLVKTSKKNSWSAWSRDEFPGRSRKSIENYYIAHKHLFK